MSELYNNNPTADMMFSQAQNMDIMTFASVAVEEDEIVDPYANDPEIESEEETVEQIFEDFGAPLEQPPEVPLWIRQQHLDNVNSLRNEQLASQSATEDGLTNLSGPQYHLEKLDHKHRMGDVLQALYPEWQYSANAANGKGFFAWLDDLTYFQTYALLKNLKGDDFARTNTPSFMKGVQYLDQHSRRHYQVMLSPRFNCLQFNSRPLDTKHFSTMFSGKGWAAWVLSASNKFYTGPHIKGQFHHSSFVSGGMVKAAGEWKVENGRLKYITGKTGHYKCPIEKLVEALEFMQNKVGLSGANVIVWDPHTKKPIEFPAIVFISNKIMQEEYIAIGAEGLHQGDKPKPQMQIGAHRLQP